MCRWSARQALRHTYFKELRERDKLQQAFLNASTRSLRTSPRHETFTMNLPVDFALEFIFTWFGSRCIYNEDIFRVHEAFSSFFFSAVTTFFYKW